MDGQHLDRFKELILRTCGFRFENDREITLKRALLERLNALHTNPADYLILLNRDQGELNVLIERLTINETYFFRESEYLDLIGERLVPEVRKKVKGRPVRILCAGCSTGEEPYSVAIMLNKKYGDDCAHMFSIAGVDIDTKAIDTARKGAYQKGSFRGMDHNLLHRYFIASCQKKETFQIVEAIRQRVEFEVVNLCANPYPPCMRQPDIILYRNVSIYFPQEVQQEIFRKLAGMLRADGYLLVGAAETIHHNIGILSLVEMDSLYLYQNNQKVVFEERRKQRRSQALAHWAKNEVSVSAPRKNACKERTNPSAPVPCVTPPSSPFSKRQAAANSENEYRRIFDDALEHAHCQRYDEALTLLETLLARQEDFVKAYSLKASILLGIGRFNEVHAVCAHLLTLDPLCIEGHLMLGIVARHEGDNDTAFTNFRHAIYLNQNCWLAHFYMAEILFAEGDRKRARSGYDTTLRILGKDSAEAHAQEFFPLSFNAEQFIAICRHKQSLLKENG